MCVPQEWESNRSPALRSLYPRSLIFPRGREPNTAGLLSALILEEQTPYVGSHESLGFSCLQISQQGTHLEDLAMAEVGKGSACLGWLPWAQYKSRQGPRD